MIDLSFARLAQIHSAVQQVGFRRTKRGYKSLGAIDAAVAEAAKTHKDPTDPYFTYQWYLVSYIDPIPIDLYVK